MRNNGVGDFRYYVGINSLAEVATREDRVCVLNILGGESSEVTPVGHAYSGGNVVFGTSPGKKGQVLETPIGPIPVYNNVRDGLNAGHSFNCGVVYLPPSAADDGVVELVRVNPALKKIFIPTEKMSVHDAREIRAVAQLNGIDIFGGNSLGVADAWNQVRIGGALGGDHPSDSLRKGSIAILSNSGGFTTTIAQYMRMAGWGTTTLISSGKDVYIHYAAPEFAFALAHDDRSKAAVLYCEPGGYYERDANFTKPVVACVVGRWKSKLTRAVGHAGALAGGADDAASKERWFMEKFGVDSLYTPQNPVVSAKGAVVINIADIPAALTAVMRANGVAPDFEPEGTMELKPWFKSSRGLRLPAELDLPVVEAPAPYNEQIVALRRQIGAVFPRQSMKDTSGASQMDARSQLTSLYGVSMLDAAQYPLEANVALALLHEPGGANDQALVNVAIGSGLNLLGHPALAAAQAARDAGNSPNSVLATAAGIFGPRCQDGARKAVRQLIDAFAAAGLESALDERFDVAAAAAAVQDPTLFSAERPDASAQAMLAGLEARGVKSAFVRYLRSLPGHPSADGVLAAITTTLVWGPLTRKRVSRHTAESLPWFMRLFGALIGASVPAASHRPDSFCGIAMSDILERRSIGEVAFIALLGLPPKPAGLFSFQVLVGCCSATAPERSRRRAPRAPCPPTGRRTRSACNSTRR
jgi:succinyl-CoA synthetase alpha subunit